MPFDPDFSDPPEPPVLTPAQVYAERTTFLTQDRLKNDVEFVEARYREAWENRETNPQEVVDRFVAFGTHAKVAFAALAIRVGGLGQTLQMFLAIQSPGTRKYLATADLLARLAALAIPEGWDVPFNEDGSVGTITFPTPTPPTEGESSDREAT